MDTDKLIEAIDLPKALLEKTSAFLDRLLGSSVDESGQLIADKIRYRRFKNQLEILQKSEKILREAGRKPQAVSLQTLVPLIEKASLEEHPSLQEMWARLLAKAATSNAKSGIHRLCVHVLANISPIEALILQRMFETYKEKRPELITNMRKWNQTRPDIPAEFIFFRPSDIFREAGVPEHASDLLLDNLLRLNLLRWEVPEIEDGEYVNPSFIHLTELGLSILKECIGEFSASPSGNTPKQTGKSG